MNPKEETSTTLLPVKPPPRPKHLVTHVQITTTLTLEGARLLKEAIGPLTPKHGLWELYDTVTDSLDKAKEVNT